MSSDTAKSSPETLLLIHGTFAGDDLEDGTAWWQRNSCFVTALERMLRDAGGPAIHCLPRGSRFLYPRPWWQFWKTAPLDIESVFHWSGDNSETARRQTGELLLAHLKAFDACGGFHVIAHSHGGSALWEALCLAAERHNELSNLRTWTTVGTPFISFRPDYACLVYALPFAGISLLSYHVGSWFIDFWRQALPEVRPAWLTNSLTLFVFGALSLLLVCLVVRFLWSLFYYYQNIAQCPNYVEEVRANQRSDIWSTVIALGFASIAALSAFWFLDTVPIWALNRDNIWPIATSFVLLATNLALLWYYFAATLFPFTRRLMCRRRSSTAQKAWTVFSPRYLCLVDQALDEPMIGLRAIRQQIRGTVLPRLPSPRDSLFSRHLRHVRCLERESSRQTFGGWLWGYLMLPLAILKDWFFAPIYNEVFATLIDEYVLARSRARAMGNDIAGLAVSEVTALPLGSQPGFPICCPASLHEELQAKTNAAAPSIAHSLRQQLAMDYPVGPELAQFLQNAMRGAENAGSLLVHTSYFSCDEVKKVLVARLTGKTVDMGPQTAAPNGSVNLVETACMRGGADFFWWLVRWATRIALLLLPVMLIGAFSYFLLYPFSDAYHRRYAEDVRPALDFANSRSRDLSQGETPTPRLARWWVARTIMIPARKEDIGGQIQNAQDRVYYYCKSSQKLAQLGDSVAAGESFRLACQVTQRLNDAPTDEKACLRIVARSIAISRVYVGSNSLPSIDGLFAEAKDGERLVADLKKLILAEEARLDRGSWKGDINKARELLSSSSSTEEVLSWAGSSATPDLKLKRLALAASVALNEEVETDAIGQECSVTMQAIIASATTLSPVERKRQIDPLVNTVCRVLAISETVSDQDLRSALVKNTSTLISLLEECPEDETGDVLRRWLLAVVVLSWTEAGKERSLTANQWLALAEKRVDELRPSVDRGPFLELLCQGNAGIGNYVKARHIAEGSGTRVRLACALGILTREIEQKMKDKRDRVKMRFALIEEWLPDS